VFLEKLTNGSVKKKNPKPDKILIGILVGSATNWCAKKKGGFEAVAFMKLSYFNFLPLQMQV